MRVLIACEFSGRVRDAFIRRGYDAMSCDLLPSETPGPHYRGNVRNLLTPGMFDLMIAHPPCRYLCNSGVRWLYKNNGALDPFRWQYMREAAKFFRMLLYAPFKYVAVENPIMHRHARRGIRKQDQIVQPWWFGDKELKATCWWLRGLPKLERTNVVQPPDDPEERKKWANVHRASPGPDRWKERSRTFPGMADAIAEQWSSYVDRATKSAVLGERQ